MHCNRICARAAKVIYTTRLHAALDELVARVAGGSHPDVAITHIAREHKVSEADLISEYSQHVYIRQSHLEPVF